MPFMTANNCLRRCVELALLPASPLTLPMECCLPILYKIMAFAASSDINCLCS